MVRFRFGLKIFTVISLCLISSGCGRRKDRIHHSRIDHAHICTVNCQEHYYVEDRVVIRPGHLHASNCGHRWDGSRWRVVGHDHVLPPRRISTGRVRPANRPVRVNRPSHRQRPASRYDSRRARQPENSNRRDADRRSREHDDRRDNRTQRDDRNRRDDDDRRDGRDRRRNSNRSRR